MVEFARFQHAGVKSVGVALNHQTNQFCRIVGQLNPHRPDDPGQAGDLALHIEQSGPRDRTIIECVAVAWRGGQPVTIAEVNMNPLGIGARLAHEHAGPSFRRIFRDWTANPVSHAQMFQLDSPAYFLLDQAITTQAHA